MRTIGLLLLGAAALALTGCSDMVSLNPLYTEDSAAAIDLEGVWRSDSDIWILKKDGSGFEAKTADGQVKVHAVKLGETLLLDIEPADSPAFCLPVHMIARVTLSGDDLQLAFLDSEWARAQANRAGLPALRIGGKSRETLLGADTAPLREFVGRIAGDARAYGDSTSFRRMR